MHSESIHSRTQSIKPPTISIPTPIANPKKQVQTPQQRRANEAYAKSEAAKRGKPQTEVERIMEKKKASKAGAQKSPVSKVWLCKFTCPIYPVLSSVEIGVGEQHAQALEAAMMGCLTERRLTI
jgi:hypothetical protein